MTSYNNHYASSSHKLLQAIRVTGKRASLAGQKAKLGADVAVLNQKIKARKHQFGVDLYDSLAALVEKDPMVLLNTNDTGPLQNIQGLFVAAYRNNKALLQKRTADEERLTEQAEKRRCVNSRHGGTLAYEVPADTVGERIMNAPKLARIRGEETRLRGNIASINQQVTHNKYDFGRQCYDQLLALEQQQGNDDHWTPTHQDVRNHYIAVRHDMAQYEMLKDEKWEDRDLLEEEQQKI